ncbi:MAG: NIL domain-containing protein [Candidatus Omnitrophota bacterium]|nr:NIL domain-containing protein [Candidatus Omnitrophota bacterium]
MKIRAELTFSPELKDEPTLCNLCKKFDIVLNIVEASFSTATGWSILILEGSEEELDRAFKYLKNSGVIIEESQKIA